MNEIIIDAIVAHFDELVSIVGEIGDAWDDEHVEHAAQVCDIPEDDAAEMLDRLHAVRFWINAVAVKHADRVGMEAYRRTSDYYDDILWSARNEGAFGIGAKLDEDDLADLKARRDTSESYHDIWRRAYDEATKVLHEHERLLQIAEADSVEDAVKEIWAQYEP